MLHSCKIDRYVSLLQVFSKWGKAQKNSESNMKTASEKIGRDWAKGASPHSPPYVFAHHFPLRHSPLTERLEQATDMRTVPWKREILKEAFPSILRMISRVSQTYTCMPENLKAIQL